MTTIDSILGREIIDSRGNPTLEVEVKTREGKFRASVPSGASIGSYEAMELRDKDAQRFHGLGVLNSIKIVNETISKRLENVKVEDQHLIDQILHELDGSANFSNIGANTALGVSMAIARAGAAAKGIPLFQHIAELSGKVIFQMPVPAFNMISGGVQASTIMSTSTDEIAYQEFMIIPEGFANFRDALRAGCEIYHELRNILFKRFGRSGINVGDEGGFSPSSASISECYDVIVEAIEAAGYNMNIIKIAIDVSASAMYKAEKKVSDETSNPPPVDRQQLIEFYLSHLFTGNRGKAIVCLEDPFDENDWLSFTQLTEAVTKDLSKFNKNVATQGAQASPSASAMPTDIGSPNTVLIVGDDLLASNIGRIHEAAEKHACNALLLKPNQCGTITDSIQAALVAEKYGWTVLTARRSGETEDDFIADLSVGIGAKYIKAGAPCRSERLAKYNQLARIEEMLDTIACSSCGSLDCKCPDGQCSCQPKSGNDEFNFATRYKTHCT